MNPVYHQAKFINSSPHLSDTPPDQGMEVAFAGRSNAGKSSAINTLTRQNALARISKTPGRTQMLNFFEINERQRFVDLPGYGYAKVPLAVKKKWHELMETYLTSRKSLCAHYSGDGCAPSVNRIRLADDRVVRTYRVAAACIVNQGG